ncbi:MAG: cysteine desulfurase family protein [Acidimicrobiales bacterium]
MTAPAPIYLDHAATTPMGDEAIEAMVAWVRGLRGNPSGSHHVARAARRALDDARDELAALLGCGPGDLVFTAGGTEADNLAVRGVAAATGAAVAASAVEHHAVLEPVQRLGGTILPVDRDGRVTPERIEAELPADAGLVSIMTVNNEVGVISDLTAVIEAVRRRTDGRAFVHTDAVAAFPWLDLRTIAAPADLLSISAHKFGGPQGVGLLVVRPGVPLRPLLLGGGQERDRRSGTQNVAGILAMAAAARRLAGEREATNRRVAARRDRFVDALLARLEDVHETVADRTLRVPGNAHLCFGGVVSEELLFLLDAGGVCASAASSCASGAIQLSHVLAAMGVAPELGAGAVRFTLGRTTTDDDVDRAVDVIVDAVGRLRRARKVA